eukprot:Em0008g835a
MVICIYKGVAQCGGYTCSSTMTVCPGTSVMCSCTINSLYNQWSFSQALCAGSAIKLNHSNDNQQCGQFIRAWNEPSHNSTELRVCSTILIRASRDLDGLTFECQDGTNGSDDVPTSYGRTALSVISVPDNPRITHVNSDNPTVLTIEWSPAENGSRPNDFNVTISIFGVSVPLSTASIAFEDGRLLPYSYTFTGLTSDTDYNVSVVSINCAGISSSVYQAGVKTDDAIKESILYAAIFLVLLILTVLLCAAIFYKLRKRTDGNENARLVSDRDEECQDDETSTRGCTDHRREAPSSEGQNPPVPFSEGQNPPVPSSKGQNPPVPSSKGQNPPAPSSKGRNPPVPSSKGRNPPVPSSKGQNPPVPSSKGRNPPVPSSKGQNPPAPSSKGRNPPAPSSKGRNPPVPSSKDQNPPVPSSKGQNPPAPSSKGRNPPVPSSKGQNSPAPSSEGQTPPAPSSEGQTPPAPTCEGQNPQLSCSAGTSSDGQIANTPNNGGPSITLRQLQFLRWIDVNGKPKKVDVIAKASCEYNKLGIWLLNDNDTDIVKTLERKHNNDPQEITREIFRKWIKEGTTPVTWCALIDTFREVGLTALADDIQEAWVNADP